MIEAVVLLGLLNVALLISWGRMADKWDKERFDWAADRRELLALHADERKGLVSLNAEERRHSDDAMQVLLDRIQHPEVRQVQPSEPLEPLHTDDAEMAHIGDIVPDFVSVGSYEQIRAEEPGEITE